MSSKSAHGRALAIAVALSVVVLSGALHKGDAGNLSLPLPVPVPVAGGTELQQGGVRLTVVSGSGSGVYDPGDTVHIEPYRMPDMRVFERWEGVTSLGSRTPVDATAHLTFPMPAYDVTMTGTVRAAPLWALRETAAAGGRVFYQAPSRFHHETGGAVVLLHDAGQSADYWLRSTESRLFQRAAVARGHGVLILESSDRATGAWDTAHTQIDTNPDVRRLVEAIGAAGLNGPPLVLIGVGQGGDFAELAAHALLPLSSVHVVGVQLVGSSGADSPGLRTMPRLFVLAERDEPGLKAQVERRYQSLKERGTPTDMVTLTEWPVFPRRFWRVDGLTAADSERVHQVLVDAAVLDADGFVAVVPTGLADPGLPGDLAQRWPLIREQLAVCWSSHGFSAHGAEEMLDFAEGTWRLPVPMPTAEPTRRAYIARIEVVGGSKGKGRSAGSSEIHGDRDVVHVWADPDPPGQVFDKWTGTTRYLADAQARHTTATVVDIGCCRLTAAFRSAPAWQISEMVMDGRQVFYHAPSDPVGLVFFFHGAGGSATGWADERRAENRQLLRDAVARGYAVAVTESGDREVRKWSPLEPAINPDVQHVARLRASLYESGEVPAGLPTFGVGMSNGGGFVTRVADALGWQGAAVYAAACRRDIAETTWVPVIWLLAENDRRVSNQDAYACHQHLADRGIDTELFVNSPSPVYPGRFWRLPAVSADGSGAAYDALRSAGLLDRLDFQWLSPFETAWRDAIADAGTVPVGQAAAQLDVCFAEHRFFGDLNNKTLSFFDRHHEIEPTPVVTRAPATPTPTATASATASATAGATATPVATELPHLGLHLPVASTGR